MKKKSLIIFDNKRNFFYYNILKIYECGVILTGLEVKSLRILNDVKLKNVHIFFFNKQLWVSGVYIRLCNFSATSLNNNFFSIKRRQLLLNKKELLNLKNIQLKNIIFFIDKIYWCNSFVKIKIAVVKKCFK